MFVCWPKALCEFFRKEAFRKSQIHQNFLQAWPWAFSKKKKHAAPVSQATERMRLVLSSSWALWYRWFSLCKKTPHTLHTIHTHTHSTVKESCLAWFVVADHEEGEAEVKKVESSLLCLGKRAVLELQAVHDQLLWLFDNVRKLLKQELHKSALEHSWSECSSSTSRLIWSPKRHFVWAIDLPVAEKTPKCTCYPILGQRKLKANNVDRQLASRKAQSNSCFDLDSDRVTVLVPRQTEVSISVWGNPRNWGIPFSRPISARLFILAPRPFPGDPVRLGARWGRVRGYEWTLVGKLEIPAKRQRHFCSRVAKGMNDSAVFKEGTHTFGSISPNLYTQRPDQFVQGRDRGDAQYIVNYISHFRKNVERLPEMLWQLLKFFDWLWQLDFSVFTTLASRSVL